MCIDSFLIHLRMKKAGIGDISRNGGINRYLNEVQQSGEPVIVMRTNEPLVILIPANDAMVSIFENSYTLGKVFKEFADKDMERGLEVYLFNQIIAGMQAELLLVSVVGLKKGQELKNNVYDAMIKAMQNTMKISTEETGNAGEQPVAPSRGAKTKKGAVKRSSIRKKKN